MINQIPNLLAARAGGRIQCAKWLRSAIAVALILIGLATTSGASGANVNSSQATKPVRAMKSVSADVILKWERHTDWGDDQTQCKSLQIGANNRVMIGACGGKPEAKEFFANLDEEWAEIQNRFAPFGYKTSTDRLVFRGKGQLAGPAWQRAIVAWAHSTYGYLYGGRISATGRNVMELWYGNNEVPGMPGKCGVFAVRDIGDASVSTFPCGQTGGTAEEHFSDWLETKEWEVFDNWLYHRARLEMGQNYFGGKGKRKMNQREVAELSRWANAVSTRLLGRK